MNSDIVAARHIYGTLIYVEFQNGVEGIIDMRPILIGPIFEKVYRDKIFTQFYVNKQSGTIEWPNGADIAPEKIYSNLLSKKIKTNDINS